jgi:ankyrin repeat protein
MANSGRRPAMSKDLVAAWTELARADDVASARAWITAHRDAGAILDLDLLLCKAAEEGAADIAAWLVESGVAIDVRAKGSMRATALMMAVGRLHLACARRLLDLGADPNARDGFGFSVLSFALLSVKAPEHQPQAEAAVRTLLEAGADAAAPGADLALDGAAKLEDTTILDLLLDAGARPDGARKAPKADAATAREMEQMGLDEPPETTISPLLTAVGFGRTAAVRRLLDCGARADRLVVGNGKATTPLLYAIETNAIDMIRLLLDHDADVDALQGKPPRSPLLAACFYGSRPETVALLLERGARVDLGVDGYTPLALAYQKERRDLVDILRAHGARDRGVLGVIMPAPDDVPATLARLGLVAGMPITDVIADAAADRAGVQPDDVIVAITGTPIRGLDDLRALTATFLAADVVELSIWRRGEIRTLTLELEPPRSGVARYQTSANARP